jgi:transcriptional regulator with XRE-family HTH domain
VNTWRSRYLRVMRELREGRIARGLTQGQVARAIGKCTRTFQRVEAGEADLRALELFKLAELCGVALDATKLSLLDEPTDEGQGEP